MISLFQHALSQLERQLMQSFSEGDIGICGVAVLLSFLCGIPVNKIPHCGVAVISNPKVCETKLFAVLRHQQYQYSLHADHALWTVYMTL